MRLLLPSFAAAAALVVARLTSLAAEPANTVAPSVSSHTAAPSFAQISPLFNKYCAECHHGEKAKGDIHLDLKSVDEAKGRTDADPAFWTTVSKALVAKEMPPEEADLQPSAAEREKLIDWISTEMLAVDCAQPDPGRFQLHRLNNREFANTLRDLLYLPPEYDIASDLPADDRAAGFDNNSGTLTLSPVHIEHYLAIVEKAMVAAFNIDNNGYAASKTKLTAPLTGFKSDFSNWQEKAHLILKVLAPRIYRRPVTDAEMADLMKFVALAYAHDGESESRAVGLAIRAALLSPEFLFRLERDPTADGSGKVYQINEYELASRLSYFLWSTMPDDELFAAAGANSLRTGLDGTLKRMLADPKARSLTQDFLGQWLEIRGLKSTPGAAPELLAAMQGETEHFFDYIVREDRSIMDFLDADYTFVNGTLAKHYGIAGVEGDEFQKVQLDPARRGGIFTQASVLTLTAKPLALKDGTTTRRPSPVNRGKWILENIFNQTLPPPPPGVPPLEIDDGKELVGTVRQIFEQHRADPKCAQCHARMDPYGFALENYDGFGAWRDKDNNVAVDASGEISGKKFTTPREFRTLLAGRRADFRRAFVEKILSYALARGLEASDKCAVDEIVAAVEHDGDRFSSVILNVVNSVPFQYARGSVHPLAAVPPAPASPTVAAKPAQSQ